MHDRSGGSRADFNPVDFAIELGWLDAVKVFVTRLADGTEVAGGTVVLVADQPYLFAAGELMPGISPSGCGA